jgi:hypothetical protein
MNKTPVMTFEVPVPTTAQTNLNQYLPPGMDFDTIAEESSQLIAAIKQLEERLKENKNLLLGALTMANQPSVVSKHLQVTKVAEGTRSTLVKEELLNVGVTPQQIQAATKYSKSSSYVVIRALNTVPETEGE